MSDLERLTKAYDQCGILYVVREAPGGWSYLFLVAKRDHDDYTRTDLDTLTRQHKFIEFLNGAVVRY